MGKMSRFYFKVITRNILFLLVILGVAFFSIATRKLAGISIGNYASVTTFGLMCSSIGLMFICAYISGKRYDIVDYFGNNKFQNFISMSIGGLKAVSITYLINVVVILIHINYKNSFIFNLSGFLHFSLTWYTANMLAVLLGLLVGRFLSNFTRYIVCLMLFWPFARGIRGTVLESNINKLFNIYDDKIISPKNYSSDVIFNSFYFLDKLFILLFIVFILVFVYLCAEKKRYKYILPLAVVFILLGYGVVNAANNSISIVNFGSGDYKQKKIDENDLGYYIKDYNMEITLDNKLYNKCSLKLVPKRSGVDEVKLLLSSLFKVENVYVNGKVVDYKRNSDEVVIPVKGFNLIKDKDVDIALEYKGSVYIVDGTGSDSIYVSYNAVNLLSSLINWYPTISQNSEATYNVKGNSSSKIYSNLPVQFKKEKTFSYDFELKGKSKGINLISGNLKVYTYKGLEVVAPKTININSYLNYLIDEYKNEKINSITKEEYEKIINKKYKRIIIASGVNADVNIFNDTVILPYRD